MRYLLYLTITLFFTNLTLQAQPEGRFNIAYGEHPRHRLDVYLPDASPPESSPPTEAGYPVILGIHGGGYIFGDKAEMRPFGDYLSAQGYAVVAPNYRLAQQTPYPAPINDVVCALAWVYAHAEDYQFDVARVVVAGASAGGNAAALLGTVDDLTPYLDGCAYAAPQTEGARWLHGTIAYYPIVELSTCGLECLGARSAIRVYLDVLELDESSWGDASPLAALDGDDPPFLIVHGVGDRVVPESESILLYEQLQAAGVPVELHLLDFSEHSILTLPDTTTWALTMETTLQWLTELLTGE